VSDEKLWDESPTSRHLQVLYHQTSFQKFIFNYTVVPHFYSCFRWPSSNPWNSSVEPCGFDWTQFKNHCFTVL